MILYSRYYFRPGILTGILILNACFGMAQSGLLTKANESYSQESFAQAKEHFERYLRNKDDWDAITKLAECYRELRYYPLAEKFYAMLAQRSTKNGAGTEDADLLLKYAQALQNNGKLSEAAPYYHMFAELRPEDPRGKAFAAFCEDPPQQLLQSGFQITKLPFNTSGQDISPWPYRDGMLFCSGSVFNPLGIHYVSSATDQPLMDIFYIRKTENGGWEEPEELPHYINSKFHEGPICISPDGLTLYFSRSNLAPEPVPGVKRPTPYHTYQTKFNTENKKWEEVKSLTPHPPTYMVAHPAISPDGEWIIFSSDKPGGYGGTDLYRANFRKEWMQEPENMGPVINSPGDEQFPFFHSSGKLFFASNGHPGFGGLDMFWSRMENGAWTLPANLGKPVNSPANDFSIWMDSLGTSGFFSSNRDNGGLDDDIFSFTELPPMFCECTEQSQSDYCYTFKEFRPLEDFPEGITFEWTFGDGNKARAYKVRHCYEKPGEYEVRLNILETKSMTPIFMESSYLLNIEEGKGVWISLPDTIVAGKDVVFSGEKSRLPGIRVSDYLWDFGDNTVNNDSMPKHHYEKPGTYTVKLMISGESETTHLLEKNCTKKPVVVITPEEAKGKIWSELPAGPGPGVVQKRIEKQFDHADHVPTDYRVQVGTSLDKIETKSENFRGLENVDRIQEGENYRYFYGREETIAEGKKVLDNVKQKGFDEAILMAFDQDTLIPGQESEDHWLPGDASRYVTFSGTLVDHTGKPIGGTIYLEEIHTGDTAGFARVNSTNGQFRMQLEKGKKYGYYAVADGYYPASGYADLSGKRIKVVHKDTLVAIPDGIFAGEKPTMVLNNIFFKPGQTLVENDSWQELFRLAKYMLDHKQLRIEVTAHTASNGDPYENLNLSRRRASELEKFLIMVGVEPDRIASSGYGDRKLFTFSNGEKACMERVEIHAITEAELLKLKPRTDNN